MTALATEKGAAVAAAPARPGLLTREVFAAQWERLAHWYDAGEFDRDATWYAADALAAPLARDDVTFWFEELIAALAYRTAVTTPGYDYGAHEPAVRDPEVLEADAQRRVDEAIGHLIGGRR